MKSLGGQKLANAKTVIKSRNERIEDLTREIKEILGQMEIEKEVVRTCVGVIFDDNHNIHYTKKFSSPNKANAERNRMVRKMERLGELTSKSPSSFVTLVRNYIEFE